MAGAPKGNQNAAKGKPWAAAIERAIAKRSRKDTLDALDDLAEKFLSECDAGDMVALKELGDRLDGKPSQTQTIQGDPQKPVTHRVEWVVVDPTSAGTTKA